MIIIIIVVITVLSWLLCGFVLETFPHFSKLCAWWKKHARGFPETGTTGRWSIHMSSKESRWGMDDKVMGDDIQSFGGPVFQDFLFVYIYLYWLWKGGDTDTRVFGAERLERSLTWKSRITLMIRKSWKKISEPQEERLQNCGVLGLRCVLEDPEEAGVFERVDGGRWLDLKGWE